MKRKANSFLLQLDRTLSHGLWSQLLLLFILMIGAFVFANLLLLLSPVDWESFCRDLGVNRWVAPFYLLIDGNAFTSVYENVSNQWTVFLACLIYIIGVFLFTGMMVSVMTNMIERRVEKHRSGLVFYHGHAAFPLSRSIARLHCVRESSSKTDTLNLAFNCSTV